VEVLTRGKDTELVLPIIPVTIGVDPGSWSLGIALIEPDGRVKQTWAVRDSEPDYYTRLRLLCAYTYQVLLTIKKAYEPEKIQVIIESGIFKMKRHQAVVIARLGEVRGMVMANAWRLGMETLLMAPCTWKTMLTVAEREMKKDKAYVAYWNAKLGMECRTEDEVDAAQIGRRFVIGK
jgi:Holliday junction resolvasome RuvABC endonuclease subunit